MDETFGSWPVWLAYGVLFLGALARGTATYWVGRGLRLGVARVGRKDGAPLPPRPALVRAERVVRRYGAPAVSLGFLTVGFQTAINLTAGALRMPASRFGPAVVVGALLWAGLYLTVGLAVVDVVLGRVPWWWLLAALAVVVAVVTVSRRLTKE